MSHMSHKTPLASIGFVDEGEPDRRDGCGDCAMTAMKGQARWPTPNLLFGWCESVANPKSVCAL